MSVPFTTRRRDVLQATAIGVAVLLKESRVKADPAIARLGPRAPWVLGFGWALMPCGLLYSALLVASLPHFDDWMAEQKIEKSVIFQIGIARFISSRCVLSLCFCDLSRKQSIPSGQVFMGSPCIRQGLLHLPCDHRSDTAINEAFSLG